jgi:chromosome segregation ATPase
LFYICLLITCNNLIFIFIFSVNQIEKLKNKLEDERRKIGLSNRTKNGVIAELSSAQAEYELMKTSYRSVQTDLASSKLNVEQRSETWKNQRTSLQKQISKNFDIYMQKKGFAGGVKFDHNLETLHLQTQTDHMDENTQCTDIRQLSGGERSYTTLCLLLALGLAVIYCLYILVESYYSYHCPSYLFVDRMPFPCT